MALRVQVPNNHILTQNQYHNYYYPEPKYLTIGYMDPLGGMILAAGFVIDFTVHPKHHQYKAVSRLGYPGNSSVLCVLRNVEGIRRQGVRI